MPKTQTCSAFQLMLDLDVHVRSINFFKWRPLYPQKRQLGTGKPVGQGREPAGGPSKDHRPSADPNGGNANLRYNRSRFTTMFAQSLRGEGD